MLVGAKHRALPMLPQATGARGEALPALALRPHDSGRRLAPGRSPGTPFGPRAQAASRGETAFGRGRELEASQADLIQPFHRFGPRLGRSLAVERGVNRADPADGR